MEKCLNGKLLAERILARLKKKVARLKKKGVVPQLAIFSVNPSPSSLSFIKAKGEAARKIGVQLKHFKFKRETSYQDFAQKINKVAKDPQFSGVLIQKPLPAGLSHASLDLIIPLEKDIDGGNPKSPFTPPVAMAVLRILDFIRRGGKEEKKEEFPSESLLSWLNHHSILLIGRGETAGRPIAKTLAKHKVKFLIAHRGTEDLPRFIKKADIVISCVGKRIIEKEMIKEGAILIGVGVRKEKGRFRGDFEEKEIKEVASFYTPTPGGVGPLTVACLMENLVSACETAHGSS